MQFLSNLEEEEETQHVSPNDRLVPPGQRPCPICGKKMYVEEQQGIKIDACDDHGIWLDRGELRTMISRIRSGERIDRQRLIRQARTDGKKSGILFGVWSLFFD